MPERVLVVKVGEEFLIQPGVIYYMPDGQQKTICAGCGQFIQLNKAFFGSLHLCQPESK